MKQSKPPKPAYTALVIFRAGEEYWFETKKCSVSKLVGNRQKVITSFFAKDDSVVVYRGIMRNGMIIHTDTQKEHASRYRAILVYCVTELDT